MQTVLHVSSPGPHDYRHGMVNVLNLLADDTLTDADDDVVLVTNGGAFRMLLGETSDHPEVEP